MTNITIFVDLDGVICDFDKSVDSDPTYAGIKMKWLQTLKKYHREDLEKMSKDDRKILFKGTQTDPTMIALKKAWRPMQEYSFVIAGKPGFFLNLPEMPGARELLQKAADVNGGKLPTILTAPIESNPVCEKEKREWMRNHFPGMYGGFFCTQQKHLHASPEAVLIDDRAKYVIPFEAAGGRVVLYKNVAQAIKDLERVVKEIKQQQQPSDETVIDDKSSPTPEIGTVLKEKSLTALWTNKR